MTLIRSLLTAHSATCAEWAVKRDLISVIRDLVKCQKCQKALPLARTWPLDTASLRADADFAVYLFFPFLFSPFSLLFFFCFRADADATAAAAQRQLFKNMFHVAGAHSQKCVEVLLYGDSM